jgi:hypothetical protein
MPDPSFEELFGHLDLGSDPNIFRLSEEDIALTKKWERAAYWGPRSKKAAARRREVVTETVMKFRIDVEFSSYDVFESLPPRPDDLTPGEWIQSAAFVEMVMAELVSSKIVEVTSERARREELDGDGNILSFSTTWRVYRRVGEA